MSPRLSITLLTFCLCPVGVAEKPPLVSKTKTESVKKAGDAQSAEPVRHAVRGTVRSHREGSNLAVIAHEEIPGYMEAMTMPLVAKQAADLAGIRAGDRIRFRLNVTDDDCWIDRIETLARAAPASASFDAAAAPQDAAASSSSASGGLRALVTGGPFPDFSLTDHLGKKCSLADYRGQAFALTFIYTNCPLPTFCPRVNRHYQEAQKLIAGGQARGARLLSVTIDPARDTVEHLSRFASGWGANPDIWRFATGRLEDITALSLRCGLSFWDAQGLIQHNLRTIVVDREGRVRQILQDGDWTAAQLSAALEAASSPAPENEKK